MGRPANPKIPKSLTLDSIAMELTTNSWTKADKHGEPKVAARHIFSMTIALR